MALCFFHSRVPHEILNVWRHETERDTLRLVRTRRQNLCDCHDKLMDDQHASLHRFGTVAGTLLRAGFEMQRDISAVIDARLETCGLSVSFQKFRVQISHLTTFTVSTFRSSRSNLGSR